MSDDGKPHWMIEHSVKVVLGFILVAVLAWIGANYEGILGLCQMLWHKRSAARQLLAPFYWLFRKKPILRAV